MKRRVSGQICYRESVWVRADTEGTAENGLGAAHRSFEASGYSGRSGQGCDGFTRYSDKLSMNHFSSVVDKAYIVRYK